MICNSPQGDHVPEAAHADPFCSLSGSNVPAVHAVIYRPGVYRIRSPRDQSISLRPQEQPFTTVCMYIYPDEWDDLVHLFLEYGVYFQPHSLRPQHKVTPCQWEILPPLNRPADRARVKVIVAVSQCVVVNGWTCKSSSTSSPTSSASCESAHW